MGMNMLLRKGHSAPPPPPPPRKENKQQPNRIPKSPGSFLEPKADFGRDQIHSFQLLRRNEKKAHSLSSVSDFSHFLGLNHFSGKQTVCGCWIGSETVVARSHPKGRGCFMCPLENPGHLGVQFTCLAMGQGSHRMGLVEFPR